ncbi:hypothetical protein MKEN_01120800 [Mycena kentingensis (nom. inval.)]|nr:hypothetical protein MKEN_01120800 [Mycena kentingensis (nom. inval.)]
MNDAASRNATPLPLVASSHPRFYVSNVNVTLQVEDTLFQIPASCLERNSKVFADMFKLPQGDDDSKIEGKSDANPIHLPGVSVNEFENLLEVLFPIDAFERQQNLSTDQWIDVLKLSTMWRFSQVREMAIQTLTRMAINSVDRIVLAKRYHVPSWLQTGEVS